MNETDRIESLWAGEFGNAYTQRNQDRSASVASFWEHIYRVCNPRDALEIGCNVGSNLKSLSRFMPAGKLYGVDVNEAALDTARQLVPGIVTICAPARAIDLIADDAFDLVFTRGVLIHQPDSSLPEVMAEMVRISCKWIVFAEYYAEGTETVPYRGHDGILFKRDYGTIFLKQFPDLHMTDCGLVEYDTPSDETMYWIFKK